MQLSPGQMFKLAKFAGLRTQDLTTDIVCEIGSILGAEIPKNAVNEVIRLIQADDVDSLADWAGNEANIQRLQAFLASAVRPQQAKSPLIKCPHCEEFFELSFE